MNYFVRGARNNVLFGHCLKSVRDWLKNAEGADPIRAVAILYSTETFSLENGCKREKRGKNEYDHGDGNQGRDEWLPLKWRQVDQQLLQIDKDLVHTQMTDSINSM